MLTVLFLGGPLNGQHHRVDQWPPPPAVRAALPLSVPIDGDPTDITVEAPQDVEYTLRWRRVGATGREAVYVAPDYTPPIVAWLRTQFDEDEGIIRAFDRTARNGFASTAGREVLAGYIERAQAEVNVKRQILDELELIRDHSQSRPLPADVAEALDRIAGALTQTYTSRTGYRPEWKP